MKTCQRIKFKWGGFNQSWRPRMDHKFYYQHDSCTVGAIMTNAWIHGKWCIRQRYVLGMCEIPWILSASLFRDKKHVIQGHLLLWLDPDETRKILYTKMFWFKLSDVWGVNCIDFIYNNYVTRVKILISRLYVCVYVRVLRERNLMLGTTSLQ